MELSPKAVKEAVGEGRLVISVYGLGWMGLPTACLFAEAGATVIGVDIDPRVIELIGRGESPVDEPALNVMLKKYLNSRINVTSDLRKAASESDVMILVVPTNVDEGKKPDYSSLEKTAKEIGLQMKKGSIIVIESTVGPGVTEGVVKRSLEASSGLKAGIDFGLVYSPIRAMAGKTLHDIRVYPRIIGGINKKSLEVASALLECIVSGGMVKSGDIRTAEATKIFENIYRDVNIALVNELAIFCETVGLDFKEAKDAANTQPYCHLHEPGVGVGGHCIPVNPYFLVEVAEKAGVDLKLIKTARKINDVMPEHTIQLVTMALKSCKKTMKRARIAVLGISYRSNVKEAKNSPSSEIIRKLIARGAKVSVYDPYYTVDEIKNMGYSSAESFEKTVEGSDCMLITVNHDAFKHLKLENITRILRKPACIVDGCRIFNPKEVMEKKILYFGIGLGRDE